MWHIFTFTTRMKQYRSYHSPWPKRVFRMEKDVIGVLYGEKIWVKGMEKRRQFFEEQWLK